MEFGLWCLLGMYLAKNLRSTRISPKLTRNGEKYETRNRLPHFFILFLWVLTCQNKILSCPFRTQRPGGRRQLRQSEIFGLYRIFFSNFDILATPPPPFRPEYSLTEQTSSIYQNQVLCSQRILCEWQSISKSAVYT